MKNVWSRWASASDRCPKSGEQNVKDGGWLDEKRPKERKKKTTDKLKDSRLECLEREAERHTRTIKKRFEVWFKCEAKSNNQKRQKRNWKKKEISGNKKPEWRSAHLNEKKIRELIEWQIIEQSGGTPNSTGGMFVKSRRDKRYYWCVCVLHPTEEEVVGCVIGEWWCPSDSGCEKPRMGDLVYLKWRKKKNGLLVEMVSPRKKNEVDGESLLRKTKASWRKMCQKPRTRKKTQKLCNNPRIECNEKVFKMAARRNEKVGVESL